MRIARGEKTRPAMGRARSLRWRRRFGMTPRATYPTRDRSAAALSGRERELVATLRRLAALDSDQASAVDLRREAKTLAEGALGDADLVEAILARDARRRRKRCLGTRRAHHCAQKAGDFKEVYALLVRQADLAADAATIRDKRHAAAWSLRRSSPTTSRPSTSTSASSRTSPTTNAASSALRGVYAKANKHKEFLALLLRLIDLATSPRSAPSSVWSARRSAARSSNAVTEATEHLRAILDEDPGNEKATLFLSQLLEKSGRDSELADLLSSQIELAGAEGASTRSSRSGFALARSSRRASTTFQRRLRPTRRSSARSRPQGARLSWRDSRAARGAGGSDRDARERPRAG